MREEIGNKLRVRGGVNKLKKRLMGVILLTLGFLVIFIASQTSTSDPDPTCVDPPAGMISWWPGDGNANDIVDGNHGNVMNGATYAPGKVGQAFSFDGVDDYVDVGNNPVFNFNNGEDDFTIDAWVYVSSYPSLPEELCKNLSLSKSDGI